MELTGKRVLVYGAGKSGLGAVELLKGIGAVPVLYDEKKVCDIENLDAETLKTIDLCVLSPGVPTDLPRVMEIRETGIPIIGEVELAYLAGKGTVLAVTGTNGKTTTTALTGAIMEQSGAETFVVGNIGNAYTGEALKMHDDSVVVAEISSFQLETIKSFRPHVSAILNITPDHLNRHHTMEEYIRVKECITTNQTKDDVCVLNYEDPVLRDFGEQKCPADVFWFSSARELSDGIFLEDGNIRIRRKGTDAILCRTDELLLIGVHNYENVMAAAAIAFSAGVSTEVISKCVRTFRPVAHRIEYAGEKNGVIWYNDSKGTNPDAAIRGIRAMTRPTFLIAGGYDKGSDYGEWIRSFEGRVKTLLLEGATAEKIRESALSNGFPEERIVMCGNMTEAMKYAAEHAEAGDAVLLSPACASWGEFPNYEVRGDVFKKYVQEEIPEKRPGA